MPPTDPTLPRILGCYPPVDGGADPLRPAGGPTVVAICASHGNEPAGVAAARSVLAALAEGRPATRGRFVALVGNRGALARGVRYVDADLNRLWTPDRVAALERGAPRDVGGTKRDVRLDAVDAADDDRAVRPSGASFAEEAEQAALFTALRRLAGPPDAPHPDVAMIDLHTTSAPSAPFAIAVPTARNRRLLAGVPLPLVHGLESRLTGTLTGWLARSGHAAVSVEGGLHEDPASAAHLAHVLWLALANHGVVARVRAEADAHRAALAAASRGGPRSLAVGYRHAITAGDAFTMRPGYRNFQRVKRGDVLATSAGGPVRAPVGGAILFPLYQGLGDEGFFIGRRLATRWPPAGDASLEVPE